MADLQAAVGSAVSLTGRRTGPDTAGRRLASESRSCLNGTPGHHAGRSSAVRSLISVGTRVPPRDQFSPALDSLADQGRVHFSGAWRLWGGRVAGVGIANASPHLWNMRGFSCPGTVSSGPCVLSSDPLVVACDLLMRVLAFEHLGELGHAGVHAGIERVIEPDVEQPALGSGHSPGVCRDAV
jgi:hypothetical protein